jgi:hypothetical protein
VFEKMNSLGARDHETRASSLKPDHDRGLTADSASMRERPLLEGGKATAQPWCCAARADEDVLRGLHAATGCALSNSRPGGLK